MDIKVKEGAQPYHTKPFAVPKIYEKALEKEVDQYDKIGVLWKVNQS